MRVRSDPDWDGSALAAISSALVAASLSFGLGMAAENNTWERMLVDSPGAVAAIRSRVLLERAEEPTK